VGAGRQAEPDLDPLLTDVPLADRQRLPDQLVGVHGLAVEPDQAPAEPVEVQQVVDQPGLELDAAADRVERREHPGRGGRVVEQGRGQRQRRGQRSAQFVAEGGQEPVLRPAGGLRLRPRHLLLDPPLPLPLGLTPLAHVVQHDHPPGRTPAVGERGHA
jgi:hypothetical protein